MEGGGCGWTPFVGGIVMPPSIERLHEHRKIVFSSTDHTSKRSKHLGEIFDCKWERGAPYIEAR